MIQQLVSSIKTHKRTNVLFAFVCIGLAVIEELGGGPEKSA